MKSFIDTVVWRLGDGLAGVDDPDRRQLGPDGRRAGDVGEPGAAGRLAGGGLGRAAPVRREPAGQHPQLPPRRRARDRRPGWIARRRTCCHSSWAARTRPRCFTRCKLLGAGDSPRHPSRCPRPAVTMPTPRSRAEAIRVLDEGADTGATGAVEKAAVRSGPARAHPGAALRRASHADAIRSIASSSSAISPTSRSARRWSRSSSQPGRHENLDAARLLLDRMLQDDSADAQLEAARLLELLPDQFEDQIRTVLTTGSTRAGALRDTRRRPPAQARLVGRVIERLGESRAGRTTAPRRSRASATESLARCATT